MFRKVTLLATLPGLSFFLSYPGRDHHGGRPGIFPPSAHGGSAVSVQLYRSGALALDAARHAHEHNENYRQRDRRLRQKSVTHPTLGSGQRANCALVGESETSAVVDR